MRERRSPSAIPAPGDLDHAPGTLLILGRAASPQFTKPFRFRLTARPDPAATCDGWAWIKGYQLDDAGKAIEQRSLFVRIAGVRIAS